jgi:Virulence factor
MAEIVLVSWRDIPAQVIARAGRSTAKRVLAARFQEAIDRAAMRAGLRDSDAYLAEWRRSAFGPCGDDLDAEAAVAASRIEADYTDQRLRALVANGGSEPQPRQP